MTYKPRFMSDAEGFNLALEKVNDSLSWIDLRKNWLNSDNWPKKSQETLAIESKKKKRPIEKNGRRWSHTYYYLDIDAETRYQYIAITTKYLNKYIFNVPIDHKPVSRDGWVQDCPYCEVSTSEIGDDNCPFCNRKLILRCTEVD